MSGIRHNRKALRLIVLLSAIGPRMLFGEQVAGHRGSVAARDAALADGPRVVDLSLVVAEGYPCTPARGFPRFRLEHTQVLGSDSAYNVDTLTIDGNTGTQLDLPAHSVTVPELGLPNAGRYGAEFAEVSPVWKLVGEACAVDVGDLLDQAPAGTSPLIAKDRIVAWERANRELQPGDVVLFRSGFSDRYYRPLPAGRRYNADPMEGRVPAWPDPDPAVMEYLAGTRLVHHVVCDSPTMGPQPNLAEATHFAALKHGAVFTEGATNLGKLPTTGAFYCMLGVKHRGGPYTEGRAFAILGQPLAARLIASARAKRVMDLSVVLSTDHPVTWPGRGVDRHRQPYTKNDFLWSAALRLYHHNHTMDSSMGTHLVAPSYALPPKPMLPDALSPEVGAWLREFERRYGPVGCSSVTVEQVPLDRTCGWIRLIDVTSLVGTVPQSMWPASPEITIELIKRYESAHGQLRANEIVVFRSGHTDRTFKPFGDGRACMAGPLAGEGEGWPALGAEAVLYLHQKGIRCVGTDGPTLGGVDEKRALMTYWAMGTSGMVGVEFLTNLRELPANAFLLFGPIKIRGAHSGPGWAIALY